MELKCQGYYPAIFNFNTYNLTERRYLFYINLFILLSCAFHSHIVDFILIYYPNLLPNINNSFVKINYVDNGQHIAIWITPTLEYFNRLIYFCHSLSFVWLLRNVRDVFIISLENVCIFICGIVNYQLHTYICVHSYTFIVGV